MRNKIVSPVLAGLAILALSIPAAGQGASWTFATIHSGSGTGTVSSLVFGNAAHQATRFASACLNRTDQKIDVILVRDHEGYERTGPVVVTFSNGTQQLGYPGEGLRLGGKKDFVRTLVAANDPLWQLLIETNEFSYTVPGEKALSATLPGAGQVASDFLAACRNETGSYGQNQQSNPGQTQFYSCQDGTRLKAVFENTNTYSVAIVTHPSMASDLVSSNVPLIETVSGSGAAYSNGDYALQTKNNFAVLTRDNKALNCNAE